MGTRVNSRESSAVRAEWSGQFLKGMPQGRADSLAMSHVDLGAKSFPHPQEGRACVRHVPGPAWGWGGWEAVSDWMRTHSPAQVGLTCLQKRQWQWQKGDGQGGKYRGLRTQRTALVE